MTKLNTQDFFTTVTSEEILSSGDFNVQLSQAPTYTKGFITLDPSNASNREVVYFHNRVGNRIYVASENRQNPVYHAVGTSVSITTVAGFINYFSSIASSFGYVEKTGGLNVNVWGGEVRYNETVSTVADVALTLPASGTSYIYLDYATLTILQTQTQSIATTNGIILATVLTSSTSVSTITQSSLKLQIFRGVDGTTVTYNSEGKLQSSSAVGSVAWGAITGLLSSQTDLQSALNAKQATLTSGTNIKTINGVSILGSGDIIVGGGGSPSWGLITGTLSSQTDLQSALDAKQATLVSGTNIKTVNGTSLLGSGNVTISTTSTWGSITGTLSSQTDLQSALDAKQATLVSGTNIKTVNGTSLLGSGDVTISTSSAWGSITGTLSSQTDLQSALNAKVDTTRTITAGTGLSGGGDLSANRSLSLANTAVTAGAYTNANITVDAQGRITSASNGALPASSCAVCTISSRLTITTSYSTISWDAEEIDTSGFHSTSTNTSRITIPTTGKYEIHSGGEVYSSTAGSFELYASIKKNGSTEVVRGQITPTQNGSGYGAYTVMNLSRIVSATAGDYFEVGIQKTSSSTTMVLFSNNQSGFSIKYLGS